MKKLIFPILTLVLICFVIFEKCSDTVSDKAFTTQMDSLNHANDSLKVAIAKDDSVINELYILDAELNDKVLHQKTKVTTVIFLYLHSTAFYRLSIRLMVLLLNLPA